MLTWVWRGTPGSAIAAWAGWQRQLASDMHLLDGSSIPRDVLHARR